MAIPTHLVEAYDTGAQSAFDVALDEPELKEKAYPLKDDPDYYKTTTMELATKRLAWQKRQASVIF